MRSFFISDYIPKDPLQSGVHHPRHFVLLSQDISDSTQKKGFTTIELTKQKRHFSAQSALENKSKTWSLVNLGRRIKRNNLVRSKGVVLCSLGMWAPSLWSEWLDNSVVWLGLAQGLLVPGVLLLADMPHRSALSNMLKQSGRVYRHLSDHGGLRMRIGETTKPSYPLYAPFPAPFPQRLRWSAANLPSLQSLQPLDAETLRKGYGSAGYTTLLSLPSSATTFSSPWSSCSSMGQSVNSVTTNAVNDFVFRRPSVLALFEPQQTKRCDTPTPFAEESGDYESICNCDATMNSRPSSRNARCNCNAMLNGNPGSRDSFCNCNNFGHRSLESSRNDTWNCNNLNDRTVPSRDCICEYNHFGNSTSSSKGNNCNCKNLGNNSLSTTDVICNCNQLVDKKLPWRNNIFNSTRLADKKPLSRQASCSCKFNPIGSPKFTLENNENRKPQETINKNMINIILAYENPNTSFLGRVDSPENIDQIEENCFEDRSSTSSSESSDADSVQSVIIRQRVDQKGRVSSSDISRVEKKLFKCDKDTETKANTDNVVSEQRVLYSEYL
ncbi:hypothetical protein JTE90_023179 [Oedothorax gibbosus]|uniref:Uncharacterized protein n=1 Tax=Oedothorax gibbosus TaxID=931172 RepID=A0AAV6UG14_9ARAC|nr:hypothetical protein JTE90_023179 [Oedothorax gibbosus]